MTHQPITYQLKIHLGKPVRLTIGKLGTYDFPAGDYTYTGSALRNMEARISRHLSRDKKLKWHIDYLLAAAEARITEVIRHSVPECTVNQSTPGISLVPHFGASDCRAGCGSHLKYQTTSG